MTVDPHELAAVPLFAGLTEDVDRGRRTATVTASTDAKVLVLFGSEFRRLQAEQPETAASIEAAMRERMPSTS